LAPLNRSLLPHLYNRGASLPDHWQKMSASKSKQSPEVSHKASPVSLSQVSNSNS
jgi:hypothetical protein